MVVATTTPNIQDVSQESNPFAINMYVLSYDGNKKLTNANDAGTDEFLS